MSNEQQANQVQLNEMARKRLQALRDEWLDRDRLAYRVYFDGEDGEGYSVNAYVGGRVDITCRHQPVADGFVLRGKVHGLANGAIGICSALIRLAYDYEEKIAVLEAENEVLRQAVK